MLKILDALHDPSRLSIFCRQATWFAGVVGLIAAAAAFVGGFIAASIGLLAAAAALAAAWSNGRARTISELRRHLAPAFEVGLWYTTEKLLVVVVDIHEGVPFQHHFILCTIENQIVSAIPTGWATLYPTGSPKEVHYCVVCNNERIRENYVELRFDFQSIYFEELREPALAGRRVVPYFIDSNGSALAKLSEPRALTAIA